MAISPVLAQKGPEGARPSNTVQDPAEEQNTQMSQAYKDYTGKKYAEATRELQAILKKSPNIVEAHEMLAAIYLDQNQVPQAIPELEAVVRLHPKEVAGFRDNLGVAYQQTGDYPKALRLYQSALAQNPNDPALALNYALVLEKSGRHADAAVAFDKATALNPKDSRAPLYAGLLYHQAGNDAKAVPRLKSALALGTTEKFSAYIALAEAASTAKDTSGALSYYMLATQAKPGDFGTQANIGILEQNAGNKPAAEAAYRKALALQADTPQNKANIESNFGLLLISEGKLDEAAAELAQAGTGDPASVTVQDNLGVVYEKQGKKDLALAAYTKALSIHPDDAAAKSGISRLGK